MIPTRNRETSARNKLLFVSWLLRVCHEKCEDLSVIGRCCTWAWISRVLLVASKCVWQQDLQCFTSSTSKGQGCIGCSVPGDDRIGGRRAAAGGTDDGVGDALVEVAQDFHQRPRDPRRRRVQRHHHVVAAARRRGRLPLRRRRRDDGTRRRARTTMGREAAESRVSTGRTSKLEVVASMLDRSSSESGG